MRELRGIMASIVTPFTGVEEVDIDKARVVIDILIKAGVHGLVIMGDTGEYFALTLEERKRFVQAVLEHVKGRVPVIVHASAASTREAIMHAEHAEGLGADAVLLLPPTYRSRLASEVYVHFEAVARAVDLDIVLYALPGVGAEVMSPTCIARIAEIDNVSYVKDSTGIVARIREIQAACGDTLSVLVGHEAIHYEGLVAGAVGVICGIANFMPRQCVQLFELVTEKGDLSIARALWDKMFPICNLLEYGGAYMASVKAALKLIGLNVGIPCRPTPSLTLDEETELAQMLATLGLIAAT